MSRGFTSTGGVCVEMFDAPVQRKQGAQSGSAGDLGLAGLDAVEEMVEVVEERLVYDDAFHKRRKGGARKFLPHVEDVASPVETLVAAAEDVEELEMIMQRALPLLVQGAEAAHGSLAGMGPDSVFSQQARDKVFALCADYVNADPVVAALKARGMSRLFPSQQNYHTLTSALALDESPNLPALATLATYMVFDFGPQALDPIRDTLAQSLPDTDNASAHGDADADADADADGGADEEAESNPHEEIIRSLLAA